MLSRWPCNASRYATGRRHFPLALLAHPSLGRGGKICTLWIWVGKEKWAAIVYEKWVYYKGKPVIHFGMTILE